MPSAKDMVLRPIPAREAHAFIRRVHYSGRSVTNSQVHIGVFWQGKLEGALQLGPAMVKRNAVKLVRGTTWNGFLELNRLAFTDALPRNSESRALAVAMRLLRKHRPDIEWVLSYADATQCGDGTIYRAAGFLLTDIRPNTGLFRMPDGTTMHYIAARASYRHRYSQHVAPGQGAAETFRQLGAERLKGFQLRYLYFLNRDARARLAVPVIPYSEIARRGAAMYMGEPASAGSIGSDAPGYQPGEGGVTPTPALQPTAAVEAASGER